MHEETESWRGAVSCPGLADPGQGHVFMSLSSFSRRGNRVLKVKIFAHVSAAG